MNSLTKIVVHNQDYYIMIFLNIMETGEGAPEALGPFCVQFFVGVSPGIGHTSLCPTVPIRLAASERQLGASFDSCAAGVHR